MNDTQSFFKTSGGGQFFQKMGDTLKVICLYDFNPCIERMKFTPDILQSLKCVECSEEEFMDAQSRAAQMLGITPVALPRLGSQPLANAA